MPSEASPNWCRLFCFLPASLLPIVLLMQAPNWNDTIVALSTPPGVGALGVIRLSGPQAIELVNELMPGKDLLSKSSHTIHVGWLQWKNKQLDEVVVSLFKAPKSFTGENVVEISCHGSPYILQLVLEACIEAGARLARPGEFTLRAFLNEKMDLAQAEAVADVIASHSAAAHQTALLQMRGGFSKVLSHLREQLIQFSALIELELDFATEDVEFADRSALMELVRTVFNTVKRLLESFKLGNVIKHGVNVAIIGKPNAGKSTLLNALLNENRAIVSEIAGTTRDTIEEVLNIDGILFRLIDTAGIRQSVDAIEIIGVEKSLEKMKSADIVVYLFDVATDTLDELNKVEDWLHDTTRHYMLAGNKADLLSEAKRDLLLQSHPGMVLLEAKRGWHIERLKEKLVDMVLEGKAESENTIVTNARHYAALQKVEKSIYDIQEGLANHISGDLLAIDIRQCLHYLGEITGAITNEDQLDYIFSKFCIGK